ncbi:hypothetical protein JTB14_011143 [Gonioctena quinquepunctata]|nr:hypothetical protein JTB14_011143 [Gonioctena quinquepunctata]
MGPSSALGRENVPFRQPETTSGSFAQQLKIKQKFNNETEKAGYDWLALFPSRLTEPGIRKSKDVSIARATTLNRKELNSGPCEVLARKGSKALLAVTSTENGETISLVVCYNAEGNFLPFAVIMESGNGKRE